FALAAPCDCQRRLLPGQHHHGGDCLFLDGKQERAPRLASHVPTFLPLFLGQRRSRRRGAHAGRPRWVAGPRSGAAADGRSLLLLPPLLRVASEALGGNVTREDGREGRKPARTASPRIKRRRGPLRSIEALGEGIPLPKSMLAMGQGF